MRVLFFLFLLLLTDVCKGQHLFDYKKDSLATSFNVIRFAILAEEELAHSIYYIDAYSGDFLYKDEYGTREDFFWQGKGFTQRKNSYTLKTLHQI